MLSKFRFFAPQCLYYSTSPIKPIFPLSYAEDLFHSKNQIELENWMFSFNGIAKQAFSKDIEKILSSPLDEKDIEIKPDGNLYVPEIKLRRILNSAFGAGGWGLVPRSPHSVVGNNILTREYALVAHGRFISQARGEQIFFSEEKVTMATEGVKSSALRRCCKDLCIGTELWDPQFIKLWKSKHAVEVWATDCKTNQKKKLWRLKNTQLPYPFVESK
jgi:hypothetical protein